MKPAIFAISLIALRQVDADDLTSPNGQYKIEYAAEPLGHEENVELKNAKTGKVLETPISYGYDIEKYHEIAWSPDSRYLAVISRGTRTSSQVEVFSFIDDTVEKIELPGYVKGDQKWTGRYYFVKHISWERTTLKYYSYGDKIDGMGDMYLVPENWYHYNITVQFGAENKPADPKLISVVETKPRWIEGEGGADQPATAPESKSEGKEKPQSESKPSFR